MPLATALFTCMSLASQQYGLPPRVLRSVQAVEGGAAGVVHQNSNGTSDLGVMQVNTVWLGPIAAYIHWTPEAVQASLTNDGCFNIAAAALILSTYMKEAHGEYGERVLEAVGDYHSHTKLLNLAYRSHVVAVAQAMFGPAR